MEERRAASARCPGWAGTEDEVGGRGGAFGNENAAVPNRSGCRSARPRGARPWAGSAARRGAAAGRAGGQRSAAAGGALPSAGLECRLAEEREERVETRCTGGRRRWKSPDSAGGGGEERTPTQRLCSLFQIYPRKGGEAATASCVPVFIWAHARARHALPMNSAPPELRLLRIPRSWMQGDRGQHRLLNNKESKLPKTDLFFIYDNCDCP